MDLDHADAPRRPGQPRIFQGVLYWGSTCGIAVAVSNYATNSWLKGSTLLIAGFCTYMAARSMWHYARAMSERPKTTRTP